LALLLTLIALVVLVPAAGVLYQWVGSAADARRFPPPGRLIDIGGVRIHVDTTGAVQVGAGKVDAVKADNGAPPVVFEAGIAATSLSWRLVQPEIARLTTTASYDRAWLGSSGATQTPRGIWQVVDELRAALDGAGITAPRILTAHSYGGLIALAYAIRYRAEIAGLVLVDPVSASEWANPSEADMKILRRGIRFSRRGALLARLGVVRLCLSLVIGGARTLPKLVARASSGRGEAFIERIMGEIRKLPREVWPVIQAHWCNPKSFEGMARYLESLPQSAAEVTAAIAAAGTVGDVPLGDLPLADLPLIVLSADNANPTQREEHESIARLSSRGRIEVAPGSGHWIQLNQPEVVTRAITNVVAEARRK